MKSVKDTTSLNAQRLKLLLAGVIVLGIIMGISSVWFLNGILATKIAETNDAARSSQMSVSNLGLAEALKIYLDKHSEDIESAARIVADTTAYKFQNQIVEDVTRYANNAGLTIIGIDFPQDINSATVDKTTGLKSLSANIRISDGTRYTSYLKFLKLIEQNLTKMQVTDISITPSQTDQNVIANTSIGIQVYVQ